MTRDPFYRQIESALADSLDPETFERCATDLLRQVHPTLVPIRGGADAGMDGAVADGAGPAFPLTCTTGSDVVGNLRRSLGAYLQEGGTRRLVVAATSQALTARRRRNLEEAARDLSFELLQVHDRAAMANLLYASPAWCLELLNLSGRPSALSALPLPGRPTLADAALIGRDVDLRWLRGTPGDLLLVGQPGVGKTSVLQSLVLGDGALFAMTEDPGELAAAVRAQRPAIVLVDDAHARPGLLARLRHLRQETGANFRMVADCWPGAREEVARELGAGAASLRELELLPRAQILKVIQATGIRGPDRLLFELISQAEGRPGLAVTLCNLCLQRGVRGVLLGDALSADVRTTFASLVGPEAVTVLAAFAVGGRVGMPLTDVARELGESLPRLRDLVTRLAAGGVIREGREGRLSVHPSTLRFALTRDVFLAGPGRLPVGGLLGAAPDQAAAVENLLGVRGRGGNVPDDFLLPLLQRLDKTEQWQQFASLGANEVKWVLAHHPARLVDVAPWALRYAPERAIPMLLDAAVVDGRPDDELHNHPLRPVRDWTKSLDPEAGDAAERRRRLLEATLRWERVGGTVPFALRAVALALSPALEDTSQAPGEEMTIHFRSGCLSGEALARVRALWPAAREFIGRRGADLGDWSPLWTMLDAWFHPNRGGAVPEEQQREMDGFALAVIRDLVVFAAGRPGLLLRLSGLARRRGVCLDVAVDADFRTLHPDFHDPDELMAWSERIEAAVRLGAKCADQPPVQVLDRWAWLTAEAHLAGRNAGHDFTFHAGQGLAQAVRAALPWVDAMLERPAPDLAVLDALLLRAAQAGEADWGSRAERCLARADLRVAAVSCVLQAPRCSSALVERVLGDLDGVRHILEPLTLRDEIAPGVLERLLRHPDPAVAGAVAMAEWQGRNLENRPAPRESLRQPWREAVVRALDHSHVLSRVFAADAELAYDWLAERIRQGSSCLCFHEPWEEDETRPQRSHPEEVAAAADVLHAEQRRQLLALLAGSTVLSAEGLAGRLVGRDPDLYRFLLAQPGRAGLHLGPLAGSPAEAAWAPLALVALEAGLEPEEIAHAVVGTGWGWQGSEAEFWGRWAARFDTLLTHADPRLRAVGHAGRRVYGDLADRHAAAERAARIYGYG